MSDDNPNQLFIETAMAAYAELSQQFQQLIDENRRLRDFARSVRDNKWLSIRSEGQAHDLQMQADALLQDEEA